MDHVIFGILGEVSIQPAHGENVEINLRFVLADGGIALSLRDVVRVEEIPPYTASLGAAYRLAVTATKC